MEQGLSPNEIISSLTRSPHGKLEEYAPMGVRAAAADPGFFAHLIAWNEAKGQIRDSKVALPILALTSPAIYRDGDLLDNAYAHLAKLPARDLLRALRFSKSQPVQRRRALFGLMEDYLHDIEAVQARFDRIALQHRRALQELYALLHVKPSKYADDVLFKGKKPGVFGELARLKDMGPADIASSIVKHRLPFLVVSGALGAKAKDPAVVHALIGAMSPTELVTNTAMLKRMGMDKDPALRGAFETALKNVSTSGANVLKTTRAADAVGGVTAEKLRGAQERQLDNSAVEGDWAVFADVSGSMAHSIGIGCQIAAYLARMAKGKVWLVFYNSMPTMHDVTGKSLDEIAEMTKRQVAGGGTAPGCALRALQERKLMVDGIALISDLNDNGAPRFPDAYRQYSKFVEKDVPIYAYQLRGDPPTLLDSMPAAGIEMHVFNLLGGLDHYSLPTLAQTMRTNRYGLVQEINDMPLLRVKDVLRNLAMKVEPIAA